MEETAGNKDKKLSNIAEREEATLAFWREKGIFEKTLEATKDGAPFTFYDGPPFATGLPHYGHMLTSTIKDTIPRYQTMRGRYVRRVWGWDCHGLPIENLIESELGLGHKKDIEEYGIGKFNEAARASVLRYDAEWKKMIPRIGRWIDMEHSYRTMDAEYTESIWWAFKNLYEKKLIYQGFKAMQICPRCETTLSNNEVSDEYKDITDISVTVKFALIDEPHTYVLAWTTTPWTLPGNVALAINPEEEYVKVWVSDINVILAKKIFDNIRTRDDKHPLKIAFNLVHSGDDAEEKSALDRPEVVATFKGAELVGRSYTPVFDYYAHDTNLENRERGWKIYGADFVTMESGTGVVHIAPAFGEDDMALGKRENLPFVQHVAMDGTMKKEVTDFAGLQAKPKAKEKDGHQATDIQIIKHLASTDALFAKEKIIHAYPHCWRCDTPLLNYAAGSWFVKVTDIKDRLVAENATTKWVPENLRDGRFGKWLEGARDWAISRSRFWGAPLPVWDCTVCDMRTVIGSRAELAQKTQRSGNRYLVMRHGEAESNAKRVVNSKIETSNAYRLTDAGRTSVLRRAEELKGQSIDMIIVSPFARTRETAEVIAQAIGFDAKNIIVDDRIKEIDTGIFDERPITEYRAYFASPQEKFTKRPEGGENFADVKHRVMAFLEDLERTHQNKAILIVTHEYPIWMLTAGCAGADDARTLALKNGREDFVFPGEVNELSFVPFPHNDRYEFDVHRPYIDEVPVLCDCGGHMKRVEYVFDCWFESGSMPYAQFHYMGDDTTPRGVLFRKNFPADFIAEGIDQTRGWFYSMLNLSVGLFDKTPFKQVIVNGLVLAGDGQKMSKKLKNYPDPWDILNTYGADAVRYYLLASPIVRAEDTAFSEKGVDEVAKKIISRMMNVISFYQLYEARGETTQKESTHPLDRWIIARLIELGSQMTLAFDRYELDRATKPIALFVDDLSTWYIRRSRDRFKSDDREDASHALNTTHTVLLEFSKLLAPVMPFFAEHIYREMKGDKESVHLEKWPEVKDPDHNSITRMDEVRHIVSLALEARAKAGIKVRQPLGKLVVRTHAPLEADFANIISDEVNVKEVVRETTNSDISVDLDTVITPALKREGQFREFARTVQELRKTTGLTPSDMVTLNVGTNDDGRQLIEQFANELKKGSLLKEVVITEVSGAVTDIDGIPFALELVR